MAPLGSSDDVGHGRSQPPQWSTLVSRSAQSDPHAADPSGRMHSPPTQVRGGRQATVTVKLKRPNDSRIRAVHLQAHISVCQSLDVRGLLGAVYGVVE